VLALLRQRDIVDDQDRALAPDQGIGLAGEHRFERGAVPGAAGDEVVQLIVVVRGQFRRHRLDALALRPSKEATNINRRPAPPDLVAQRVKKWLQPLTQLGFPFMYVKHDRLQPRPPSWLCNRHQLASLPQDCQSSARACLQSLNP
jgi:hypothetical protein